MKVKPVILCGGSGSRLWPNSQNKLAKQFINFGNWTLLDRTLQRIKGTLFDSPIISTNSSYVNLVKKHLTKNKIKKYKIILEPFKKNTAPAILTSALLKNVPLEQTMIFYPADHYVENVNAFNKSIISNIKYLNKVNIFIFGVKPTHPSSEYGYFLTKKLPNKKITAVKKFIEKPRIKKAKEIVKKKGYWNSGIFFAKKESIVNNFKKYQPLLYKQCVNSILKSTKNKNTIFLDKSSFNKITSTSFDYSILEKSKNINGIKLNMTWSDLGSWKEIAKVLKKNKSKLDYKKSTFYRPWGSYINLHKGNGFLLKELIIKPSSSISLQKHLHRSELWTIISGKPKITIGRKKFFKKENEIVFIPQKTIHRIENTFNKEVKIVEVQTGNILKETDIIRYQDIYGRIR